MESQCWYGIEIEKKKRKRRRSQRPDMNQRGSYEAITNAVILSSRSINIEKEEV